MNQQDKELLLKDLCARLPYGVIMQMNNHNYLPAKLKSIDIDRELLEIGTIHDVFLDACKPYLRPLSSMTEKEFVYLMSIRGMNLRTYEIQEMMSEYLSHPNRIAIVNTLGKYSHSIDWLNKNMFDYRGLIPKGLALEQHKGWYRTINKDR